MDIRINKNEPPKNVVVVTPGLFEVIDADTQIGLRVIGEDAVLIGLSSLSMKYDDIGFSERSHRLSAALLCALVSAYESRSVGPKK